MLDFCVGLGPFVLHGILMGAMTSYQARACKCWNPDVLSSCSYWSSFLVVGFDCYPRTHSFQLRFSRELKGFQVAGILLAPLLLWKWFLLFILSCEGKRSVIDCNSRLKTMFVCLLLLKVWNVASICPQVTSLITDLCVASLRQAHVHPYSTWERVKEYLKIFRNNPFPIWAELCSLFCWVFWFWLA